MVTLNEILQLSIPERILMVEAIWDSIERESQSGLPLSEIQQEEIINRMRHYEEGKSKTFSWEELTEKLKSKK